MRGKKARQIRNRLFEQGIHIAAEPYNLKIRKVKTLGDWEREVQSKTIMSSDGRRMYQGMKKELRRGGG